MLELLGACKGWVTSDCDDEGLVFCSQTFQDEVLWSVETAVVKPAKMVAFKKLTKICIQDVTKLPLRLRLITGCSSEQSPDKSVRN